MTVGLSPDGTKDQKVFEKVRTFRPLRQKEIDYLINICLPVGTFQPKAGPRSSRAKEAANKVYEAFASADSGATAHGSNE